MHLLPDRRRSVTFLYAAYGLAIESEFPLDLPDAATAKADVTVVAAPVRRPARDQSPPGDGCWHADAEEALYFWPGSGAFRVHAGRTVEVDPDDGLGADVLGLIVLSRLVAAVLHQRGRLVLHASAVVGPAGAVAVAAHSGTGKSTSAAVLVRRGYEMLTDDLLAIDLLTPVPTVPPGGRGLKLWPASVEAVGAGALDPGRLRPVVAGSDKQVWPLDAVSGPVPLVGLYVLEAAAGPTVVPLAGRHAVREVMSRSYCSEELRLWGAGANLAHAAAVVQRVPVRHLRRPAGLGGFERWAETFAADAERLLDPP